MDGKTRRKATPTYCNSNWHALQWKLFLQNIPTTSSKTSYKTHFYKTK